MAERVHYWNCFSSQEDEGQGVYIEGLGGARLPHAPRTWPPAFICRRPTFVQDISGTSCSNTSVKPEVNHQLRSRRGATCSMLARMFTTLMCIGARTLNVFHCPASARIGLVQRCSGAFHSDPPVTQRSNCQSCNRHARIFGYIHFCPERSLKHRMLEMIIRSASL